MLIFKMNSVVNFQLYDSLFFLIKYELTRFKKNENLNLIKKFFNLFFY